MDQTQALQLLRQLKPQSVVVLNDENFASQCADIVPYTILRVTNNDDSLHSKIRSFYEWWNIVKPKYQDKRLIVHFGNEPKGNYGLLSTYSINGMSILYEEGRRGIFGNFATGNPEPQDLVTTLKPMMEQLNAYEGYHFLGVHEYWMDSIELSYPYEIGRYLNIVSKYPKIPIILTEFGTDIIQDIEIHHPEVPKTTGYKDYNNDAYVFNESKKAFELYNTSPQIKGVNWFCYGNSGGWEKYDTRDFNYLFDHAEELMAQTQITVNGTLTIKSTDPKGTNRRTGAGTQFDIKGGVGQNPIAVTKLQEQGDWIQFRFSDGDFWVNKNYIIVSGNTTKTITLNIYDASDEDAVKIKEGLELLSKYKVDVVQSSG